MQRGSWFPIIYADHCVGLACAKISYCSAYNVFDKDKLLVSNPTPNIFWPKIKTDISSVLASAFKAVSCTYQFSILFQAHFFKCGVCSIFG